MHKNPRTTRGGEVWASPLTKPHVFQTTFLIGHASQPACDSPICICGFPVGLLDPCNHCGELCAITRPPPNSLISLLPYGPPLTHGTRPLATTYRKENLSTS